MIDRKFTGRRLPGIKKVVLLALHEKIEGLQASIVAWDNVFWRTPGCRIQ